MKLTLILQKQTNEVFSFVFINTRNKSNRAEVSREIDVRRGGAVRSD